MHRQIEEICEIEKACFLSSWSFDQFIHALESNNYCIFALIASQSVSSYLVLQCIPSVQNLEEGEIEIINIATKADFRRKGHAKALLSYALLYAKSQKVQQFFLDVKESNQSARALYKQLDFQEIGRRKNYYTTENKKEDAILMSYSLEH